MVRPWAVVYICAVIGGLVVGLWTGFLTPLDIAFINVGTLGLALADWLDP